MGKKIYIPIIVLLAAITITALVLFVKAHSHKYNWHENLSEKNPEPYGLSILYELAEKSTEKNKFIKIKEPDFSYYFEQNPRATYIYVGTNYLIDSANTSHLIAHIRKGNKAFISSTYQLDVFLNKLIWEDDYYTLIDHIEADSVKAQLLSQSNTTYPFHYQQLKETSIYFWPYFNAYFFEDAYNYSPETLGTFNDTHANFAALKIGEGTLYLHSAPILFSNYHLSSRNGFEYFKPIWNRLNNDIILWDSRSGTYYSNGNGINSYHQLQESPLRFILKHKSLRWAWYTLLAAVIIFVVVQSKRKQNVIPLIQKKKNNTLDYAKAIGTLYFQAKSHRHITDEMIQQLYSFIKARYNFKIGKNKEQAIQRLSALSGIDQKSISEIFKLEIKLKYDENSQSEQLYKLYNLVDYFYKNCN